MMVEPLDPATIHVEGTGQSAQSAFLFVQGARCSVPRELVSGSHTSDTTANYGNASHIALHDRAFG
jgi:hypothetical protein